MNTSLPEQPVRHWVNVDVTQQVKQQLEFPYQEQEDTVMAKLFLPKETSIVDQNDMFVVYYYAAQKDSSKASKGLYICVRVHGWTNKHGSFEEVLWIPVTKKTKPKHWTNISVPKVLADTVLFANVWENKEGELQSLCDSLNATSKQLSKERYLETVILQMFLILVETTREWVEDGYK